MSFLVANLPVTPVWVKKEYLYDLEIEENKLKGEGELESNSLETPPKGSLLIIIFS